MGFDWKRVVGTVAPALGTALGGPLVGVAIKTIGDALGIEGASEAQIATAIERASPETLLALKKADQEFAIKMKELDIDIEKAYLSDVDSARKREMSVRDWTLPALAWLIVCGFIAMCALVLTGGVTVDSVLAGTLIGYAAGNCQQVLGYYFGSSKGSADKNILLGKKEK